MKIVMEHKINEEQKEELRSELNTALKDFRTQLGETFEDWGYIEKTQRLMTYAVVGIGVGGFALGYFVGRSRGD